MSLHLYAKAERSTASDHRNLPPARDHIDADDGGRLSGLEQVQAQFTVVIRGRQRRRKRWKSMENDAFNCVCRRRGRESLWSLFLIWIRGGGCYCTVHLRTSSSPPFTCRPLSGRGWRALITGRGTDRERRQSKRAKKGPLQSFELLSEPHLRIHLATE